MTELQALLAIYAAFILLLIVLWITIREDDRYFVASADAARDRILSPLPAPGREDGANTPGATSFDPVSHSSPNSLGDQQHHGE